MHRDQAMLGFAEEVLLSPIARIVCEYAHELGTENTMTSSQIELNFLVAHQNEEHFMIGFRRVANDACFYQWHSNWCHTAFPLCKSLNCSIRCLIVLPNGQIAAGTSNGRILIYDSGNMQIIKKMSVSVHAVTALGLRTDQKIIFGSEHGEVCVIFGTSNTDETPVLGLFFDFAHKVPITAIAHLSNGNCVVGDAHGTLVWYNAQSGNKLFVKQDIPTTVTALAVLASGKIVSSYLASALQVWDPDTAECLLTVADLHGIVMAMCVLQDGRLAIATEHGCVRILDPDTLRCVSTIIEEELPDMPTPRKINLAVLQDGKLAVSVGKVQTVWQ